MGPEIKTGHELLALPSYKQQSDLRDWGTYLMVILDKKDKVVGVSSGSGAATKRLFERWTGYAIHNSKLGKFPSELSLTSYINVVLENGNTVHIRPVLLASPDHCRKAHFIAFEGLITDIFNTLNVESPLRNAREALSG